MLRPLLARLFKKNTQCSIVEPPDRARPRSGLKTRLRVEALEPREVPAHLVWTNAIGDGFFGTAANWFNLDTNTPATWNPVAGDDLYFDGGVSSANCNNLFSAMVMPTKILSGSIIPMPSPSAEYHSVNLIDGYAGTVSTWSGFHTGSLVMESGALSQMTFTADLWVSQTFDWTGGTLGGTYQNTATPGFMASNSTLHLLAGSTATINPGQGNTIATGDTLSFETAGGVGSTGTFLTGTVSFVGGMGLTIDNLCTVNAQVTPAAATFVDTPQPGSMSKLIRVKSGGKMFVRSADEAAGGTFESAIPLMNCGTFQVEKNATAVIKGAVPIGMPQTNPSIYQNDVGAAIRIENGSKLVAEKGISLLAGKLSTLAKANPPQGFAQTATVVGKVSLSGGDVYICEGSNPHVFGTLVFESDVWLGAVTLHVVLDGRAPGTGDAGKSDLYDFKAGLLDGLAQPVVKVTTVNVPQDGLNQNQTWEFVRVANPIEALKPTVTSETMGTNYQVIDADQNHRWWFKPSA
jgi:hypothetical protein